MPSLLTGFPYALPLMPADSKTHISFPHSLWGCSAKMRHLHHSLQNHTQLSTVGHQILHHQRNQDSLWHPRAMLVQDSLNCSNVLKQRLELWLAKCKLHWSHGDLCRWAIEVHPPRAGFQAGVPSALGYDTGPHTRTVALPEARSALSLLLG